MGTAQEVLAAAVLALVSVKLWALLWGNAWCVRHGGAVMQQPRRYWLQISSSHAPGRLPSRADFPDEILQQIDDELNRSRPVERLISRAPGPFRKLLQGLFRAYVSVFVAALAVALLVLDGHARHNWLVLALGLANALCAFILLFTAVIRRLIFGAFDALTDDVQLPPRIAREWAASIDGAGNLVVYFLILIGLSIVAYGSCYASLVAFNHGSFAESHLQTALISWWYLSATILATVGFGDIHPRTAEAQVIVTTQIVSGPLILGWLLSVFTQGPSHPGRAELSDHEAGGSAT